MKFWFDTEFLEDGETILPISIGIVSEDGRSYYAEFKMGPAVAARIRSHEWLMENVVPHLSGNLRTILRPHSGFEVVTPWRPVEQIAREIIEFTRCKGKDEPEFWAYCGAYDWVLINQLFGPMVEHPKAWPFYCNDIAQHATTNGVNRRKFPTQDSAEHNALNDAMWTRDTYHWINDQIMEQERMR